MRESAGRVEQVHQHGLAATYGPVDVETLRLLMVGAREETGEPPDQAVTPPPALEAPGQLAELADHRGLGWVGGDRAFCEKRAVSGSKGHGRLGYPGERAASTDGKTRAGGDAAAPTQPASPGACRPRSRIAHE